MEASADHRERGMLTAAEPVRRPGLVREPRTGITVMSR